jgi:hypothetical protein
VCMQPGLATLLPPLLHAEAQGYFLMGSMLVTAQLIVRLCAGTVSASLARSLQCQFTEPAFTPACKQGRYLSCAHADFCDSTRGENSGNCPAPPYGTGDCVVRCHDGCVHLLSMAACAGWPAAGVVAMGLQVLRHTARRECQHSSLQSGMHQHQATEPSLTPLLHASQPLTPPLSDRKLQAACKPWPHALPVTHLLSPACGRRMPLPSLPPHPSHQAQPATGGQVRCHDHACVRANWPVWQWAAAVRA